LGREKKKADLQKGTREKTKEKFKAPRHFQYWSGVFDTRGRTADGNIGEDSRRV